MAVCRERTDACKAQLAEPPDDVFFVEAMRVQRGLATTAARHRPLLAARRHLAATPSPFQLTDVAVEADIKANAVLPSNADGDASVGLSATRASWKPRPTSVHQVPVETSQLFCASNNPLDHTPADVGKFFQTGDSSTQSAFELFYHNGYCGEKVAARNMQLKTSGMMVRSLGVKLRDQLLGLDSAAALADEQGWVLVGETGVGKSMVLNYVLAAMQTAGWLVAVVPHAADWTLGLSAKSATSSNEAYRITDASYFSSVPPELSDAHDLYDNPESSANFLISLYLSQKDKLAQIPLKGEERRAFYAQYAEDPAAGPTLADLLGSYARDMHNGFAEFPMPVRPVYDALAELQLVTEFPTLLVVDGWNRWSQMATSCHWRSKRPLHASDLLVPATCGGDLSYGRNMARGVMLCAATFAGAQPPGVPLRMRKHIPPPPDFTKPESLRVKDPRFAGGVLRKVERYSLREMQAVLDFYALTGHMSNPLLNQQLRTGELATKVGMLTSGVAEDTFTIATQL